MLSYLGTESCSLRGLDCPDPVCLKGRLRLSVLHAGDWSVSGRHAATCTEVTKSKAVRETLMLSSFFGAESVNLCEQLWVSGKLRAAAAGLHHLAPVSIFRIQKATESLRTFHPSADPCFDEFVLDTSREETLLKEICFGGGTPRSTPVILPHVFRFFLYSKHKHPQVFDQK